jgi:hypothetical protein
MNEHNYGTHLIKFKADLTPDGTYWIGKAHVKYNLVIQALGLN